MYACSLCIVLYIEMVIPTTASPTSIVWWDTIDQHNVVITGSEVTLYMLSYML